MLRKPSRLQFKDIAETKQRLAAREISEAELKQVSGGAAEGTTTCACDTCSCDDCVTIE
jgi:bacteriocin-like protein